MKKKIYLLIVLAIGFCTKSFSQEIVSATEPDLINFETMIGGPLDAPYYSFISRVYPYEGDVINTTEFLNSLEYNGRITGNNIRVRPPRVDDRDQLGYVIAFKAARYMGLYYHAVSIVFIDGLYRDDEIVYYFDTSLDNVFTHEEPFVFSNEKIGQHIDLKNEDSPINFRIFIDDFRKSQKGNNLVTLDSVQINRSNLSESGDQFNYKKFVNMILNPSGLSLFFTLGTGGGGRHEYSIQQIDNPQYNITYLHNFRSQNITGGLKYNFTNVFLTGYASFENIQPQNGRRLEERNPGNVIVTHGLTNSFPKRRVYFGTELGYDFRINHNSVISPYIGASTFSYIGQRSEFNDIHQNRRTLFAGLKLAFPVYSGRTLAFLSTNYSRHFFEHTNIKTAQPGSVDQIEMKHLNAFHQQFNISVGIQHKITNTL